MSIDSTSNDQNIQSAMSAILEHTNDELFQKSGLLQALQLSKFVARVCLQYPQLVAQAIEDGAFEQAQRGSWHQQQVASCFDSSDINWVKSKLRTVRQIAMLVIATRDLTGKASVSETMQHLSNLADLFIEQTVSWLQQTSVSMFGTSVNQSGQQQSLVVLAMGKLGASELNFSSDIDLIFCFDEDGMTQGGRRSVENQQYFTRIGQLLIQMLSDQTGDGFVYRVDMRLRPYGDSGALTLSFAAMEEYYQDQGREWERFAMVKARAVTGSAQEKKLIASLLKPFVFRRYIDFGVLDAIRQLKAQIAIEQRRKRHVDNIKLGQGGIREIEFIVQSLQLIRGGREPRLRERHLLTVLPLLEEFNFLQNSEVVVLEKAYLFLRKLENCLQALNDEQTQILPRDSQSQSALAVAMNIASWQDCYDTYKRHSKNVHQVFSILFSEFESEQTGSESKLGHDIWQDEKLSHLEKEEDESQHALTLKAITEQVVAFRQSKLVSKMTERGRRRLDQLMPLLIDLVLENQQNQQAMQSILDLIGAIAKRTAYLELLAENPPMLAHLVELCGMSKRLAQHLKAYPLLLDELLYPKALYSPQPVESIDSELGCALLRCDPDDAEQLIEGLRQFKLAHELRVAAAELKGVFDIRQVSSYLTEIASAIVSRVVQLAWREMIDKFGSPFKGASRQLVKGFAVIAYGKVGGKEMSYDSDLDLVYIHDLDVNQQTITFEPQQKKIEVGRFIMRLAQRIMHLLSIRTNSGVLYEVDMRLRPSGNSGLLVSQYQAFVDYQLSEAWTWEHQAITRARLIGGDPEFSQKLNQVKLQVFAKTQQQSNLLDEVVAMRVKLRENKLSQSEHHFDLKQGLGGMVDIEFIAQYLTLKFGSKLPQLASESNTIERLKILADHNLLAQSDCNVLVNAYRDYRVQVNLLAHQNLPAKVLLEKSQLKPDNVATIWNKIMAPL